MQSRDMRYDRQLLLLGAKRNSVLELAEVQAYGQDSYGNADYVSLYGLRPAEWYAKGIRLLGRTAVECTRDALADRIGRDAASVARSWVSGGRHLLIDPFAGSGNTLYWLAWHLSVAGGVGFELDPGVFALTKKNLAALALPIDVLNIDYASALSRVLPAAGQLVVAFIARLGVTPSIPLPASICVVPTHQYPRSQSALSSTSPRIPCSSWSRCMRQ